jgi:hypothetical protein
MKTKNNDNMGQFLSLVTAPQFVLRDHTIELLYTRKPPRLKRALLSGVLR